MIRVLLLVWVMFTSACSCLTPPEQLAGDLRDGGASSPESPARDDASGESLPDAGAADAAVDDAGTTVDDADATDAGRSDAGLPDAGAHDAGAPQVGPGPIDAGSIDAGPVVRFIAVGDTGRGTPAQHQVGAAIASVCDAGGCDFVVLLGDNFYPSGVTSTSDSQWNSAFVQPYANVAAPFYGVLGNHDYGGNGAGTDLLRGRHQVDYSAVNSKWRMPAHHYRWAIGAVDFFAADTNRSIFSLDQAARSDFNSWLSTSTARWKIAFGHHPLKSNGPHGNAGSYDGLAAVPVVNGEGVRRFLEDTVCGRADVYLCGHDHVLEWLQPTCTRAGSSVNTELLISGGGSSVTSFPRGVVNPVYWHAAQLGFVYVVIDGPTFTGTFYDENGAVLFERTLSKP